MDADLTELFWLERDPRLRETATGRELDARVDRLDRLLKANAVAEQRNGTLRAARPPPLLGGNQPGQFFGHRLARVRRGSPGASAGSMSVPAPPARALPPFPAVDAVGSCNCGSPRPSPTWRRRRPACVAPSKPPETNSAVFTELPTWAAVTRTPGLRAVFASTGALSASARGRGLNDRRDAPATAAVASPPGAAAGAVGAVQARRGFAAGRGGGRDGGPR